MKKIEKMKKVFRSKTQIMVTLLILLLLVLIIITSVILQPKKESITPRTDEEIILQDTIQLANYFLRSYPIASTTDITNQDKLYYGMVLLSATDKQEISASKVEQAIKKAFNQTVTHEDIYSTAKEKLYTYNAKKKLYEKVEGTFYFTGWQYNVISNTISIEQPDKETYILKTRNLFVEDTSDSHKEETKLYANYEDYKKDENVIQIIGNTKNFDPIKTIEQHEEKLPIVTFTYKKINGNYVLESII